MTESIGKATVLNSLGLHARPAAEFVKLASRFESTVFVSKGDLEVNGKSIMGVMMLAAEAGSILRIRAVGVDSLETVEALCRLVAEKFGEDYLGVQPSEEEVG